MMRRKRADLVIINWGSHVWFQNFFRQKVVHSTCCLFSSTSQTAIGGFLLGNILSFLLLLMDRNWGFTFGEKY